MQICPVCLWEDAPGESPWNGSNKSSLADAQKNFEKFGACEQEFLTLARSPHTDETKEPEWMSLQDLALMTISVIEKAFAEVTLDDGLTIHQREAISDYGSSEEINHARRLDTETAWQNIPPEKIEKLGTSLVFLDSKSIRYHLPAFMRHAVRCWLDSEHFGNGDAVLYSLRDGPASTGYHSDSFLLLNDEQRQAVAGFLHFITVVDTIYGKDADRGLSKGWREYLPTNQHI